MYELVPLNKYVVIKPQQEDEKVGSGILYRPGSALEKQHRMGQIVSFDECDESKKLTVGATVIYDSIGAVEHRVGNQMFTTVRVLNIIALVKPVVGGA
jgi:co-chaperonin GroES (HSP10)